MATELLGYKMIDYPETSRLPTWRSNRFLKLVINSKNSDNTDMRFFFFFFLSLSPDALLDDGYEGWKE